MSTEQGDDEPQADGTESTKNTPEAKPPADAPRADASAADAEPEGAAEATAGAAEEHDPWPFDGDQGSGPPELSFAGDDDLTLDAFERAVSRAVHDKLGAASADADAPAPGRPPRGADELVASVLGALTGKDARAALDEVRGQLSANKPKREDDRGADVIDLQAAREARKKQAPSDFSLTIGDALKDTFNSYLADVAQRSGRAEFTIDADFLKRHGPTLLGNLFQGLAQSLLPQMAPPRPRPPVADPAPPPPGVDDAPGDGAAADGASEGKTQGEPEATAAAPSGTGAPNVSVKVDLGSILANLFKRRPPSK